MAEVKLEDKINTTLSQVIQTDWSGKGRGGTAMKKMKGRGRGTAKGRGRVLKWKSTEAKGRGRSKGKGKGGGSVKKTMFQKVKTWKTSAGGAKGKGKGPLKVRRTSKGKGRGKWNENAGKGSSKGRRSSKGNGRGNWSENESRPAPRRGLKLWEGAQAMKGKGRGQRQGKSKGKGRPDGNRKGQGKGKDRFRTSDGFLVQRNGRFMKRQGRSKGGAKGGARALVIATGGMKRGRTSEYRKGSSKGGSERRNRNWGGDGDTSLSAEDRKMMKKITIVAQLDKVPKPSPAMQGLNMSRGRRGERAGSLSRRFANHRR